jgi:hypothetical protein
MSLHKVFISYHHAQDQVYKEALVELNNLYSMFIDVSVNTGDIDDNLSDERIRQLIRDDYLRNSTVTVLLVGAQTKARKHVDWEIYSSMIDGMKNKKSGILVINLPNAGSDFFTAPHDGEKEIIYPTITNWTTITERSDYESRYPMMPKRIIDNLLKPEAKISVIPWSTINTNPGYLKTLIEYAHQDRATCSYDFTRNMRRANS